MAHEDINPISIRAHLIEDLKNVLQELVPLTDEYQIRSKEKAKIPFEEQDGECMRLFRKLENETIARVESAKENLQPWLAPLAQLEGEIKSLSSELTDLQKQYESKKKQLRKMNKKPEKKSSNIDCKQRIVKVYKLLTGAKLLLEDEHAIGYIEQNGEKIPFEITSGTDEEVANELWKLYKRLDI